MAVLGTHEYEIRKNRCTIVSTFKDDMLQGVLAFHDFTIHDPRKLVNSLQFRDFEIKKAKKKKIKIFWKIFGKFFGILFDFDFR